MTHVVLRTTGKYPDAPVIDGVKWEGVTRVEVSMRPMDLPRVTVELIEFVDFDGQAVVEHRHTCGCRPPEEAMP